MSGIEVAGALIPLISYSIAGTQWIRDIKDCPSTVLELANELSHFSETIQALQDVAHQNAKIEEELETAKHIMEDIAKLLKRHVDHDSQTRAKVRSRIRWAVKDKEAALKLRQRLGAVRANLSLMINVETVEIHQKFNTSLQDSIKTAEIVIAVMGETGAGKSHFINQITGRNDAGVGDSLHSETQTVRAYSLTVEGRVVTLVDTPGFDDSSRTDGQVLGEVASWLTSAYESRRLLSGIIYVHPITSTRMRGSAVRSLDVFSKLVGPDSFHNILLVTTMWDLLPEQLVGQQREEQLREEWWRMLIDKGSTTARSAGDRDSALAILKSVVFDQTMLTTAGAPLAIQKEIVDEQKPLEATSAYEALKRRMDDMVAEHREQLDLIEKSNIEERARMQAEIDKLREEQAGLTAVNTKYQQHGKLFQRFEHMKIYVQLHTEDFLEIDPPPPYIEKTSSRTDDSVNSIQDLTKFSLTPIINLQNMLWPSLIRLWRPKLQKNHSRIEWTCSCGDLLYGDFIENTQGSLQNLAAQLGGRVISGPATSHPSNMSNEPPSFPPQAHTADQSWTSALVGNVDTSHDFGSESLTQRAGTSDETSIQLVAQYHTAAPQWLELCIRSGPDTYILGELDVAGTQTDQTVFQKISKKYQAGRNSRWFLGFYTLRPRVANGGVFVQFRKDKLAARTGKPATASVMKRPSVPEPQEAQHYKYVFDPVPMDEPPIDKRTFNHYFHKVHLADTSATWIKRFPQLSDASLFYSQEKLAKGWGIEITEDRNWMLFAYANILALIISGALAGLSSWLMNDKQTGVAIGAWLTAVQTLTITAVFWHWTNQ